ncbi:MAG TPA: NAD(P)-binding protein [Nitrospiraceae bacterium]|nr:NAD(P)-binding protein [Nitrospiraceae bacterium]
MNELLAKGTPAPQIVVIEEQEERVRLATSNGLTALCCDAAQEAMLNRVALDKAKAVIVAAGRDDTNVLIVLTAGHMNPRVRILANAKQEENVKLLKQGGANAVISPATIGGYALAAAVDQEHLTEYLLDLLTVGGRINLIERTIEPSEVGKRASDLAPDVVVRVYREGRIVSLAEPQRGLPLKSGDRLILLKSVQDPATAT